MLSEVTCTYPKGKQKNGGNEHEKIEAFEDAAKTEKKLEELGINPTMYWAYRNSRETGNETIDFGEVVWDYDIAPIVEACRKYGIDHITVSSTFLGLIATLAEFEKQGCRMEGLTQVNARSTDWRTGERERIPAVVIRI